MNDKSPLKRGWLSNCGMSTNEWGIGDDFMWNTNFALIALHYFMCNRKIQIRYQICEGHKKFIKSVKYDN